MNHIVKVIGTGQEWSLEKASTQMLAKKTAYRPARLQILHHKLTEQWSDQVCQVLEP